MNLWRKSRESAGDSEAALVLTERERAANPSAAPFVPSLVQQASHHHQVQRPIRVVA